MMRSILTDGAPVEGVDENGTIPSMPAVSQTAAASPISSERTAEMKAELNAELATQSTSPVAPEAGTPHHASTVERMSMQQPDALAGALPEWDLLPHVQFVRRVKRETPAS